MEFSRPEYWSGLPFPSPGDLPHPGMESGSPALHADSLHLSHLGRILTGYWPVNKSGAGNSLVVQTLGLWCFHCWGLGLIPGWGIKIPQASQLSKKKKKSSTTQPTLPKKLMWAVFNFHIALRTLYYFKILGVWENCYDTLHDCFTYHPVNLNWEQNVNSEVSILQ